MTSPLSSPEEAWVTAQDSHREQREAVSRAAIQLRAGDATQEAF